jgi:hypothetical protein
MPWQLVLGRAGREAAADAGQLDDADAVQWSRGHQQECGTGAVKPVGGGAGGREVPSVAAVTRPRASEGVAALSSTFSGGTVTRVTPVTGAVPLGLRVTDPTG